MSISFSTHRLNKFVPDFTRIYFCVCIITISLSIAQQPLPSELDKLINATISNVWNNRYDDAETSAKKIIKKYSYHPAGYFFYAATLNLYMEYSEDNTQEEKFYYYCDLAISKAEKILTDSAQHYWAQFFLGGALGLKGQLETRKEQWITAFKHGSNSVSILKNLFGQNKDLIDPLYGIAVFNYWRSAKIKLLWWMPGIDDLRPQAIEQLKSVLQNARYTKESCAKELAAIYLAEKKYKESEQITAAFLKLYPDNFFFNFLKGHALWGLHEYERSLTCLISVRNELDKIAFPSMYYSVIIQFTIFKIYLSTKNTAESVKAFEQMKQYPLNTLHKKKLESLFIEASRLMQKTLK